MKASPLLRAEALGVLLTILAGAITMTYTFATSYAKIEYVNHVEARLEKRLEIIDLKLDKLLERK